jgi:hypothetical protein
VLAALAPLAGQQRRGDRLTRREGGHLVRDDLADEPRSARRRIGLGHRHPCLGLDDRVVRRTAGLRALVAESGDRHVDQVVTSQVVVADPEALGHARPPVLDDHVAVGGQGPDHLAPGVHGEVHRDGPLAAVAGLEQGADAVDLDAHVPGDVADADPLDLDHFGALVGQEGRGVGPRRGGGQVHDLDAGQGAGGGVAHGSKVSLVRGRPPGPL